VTRVKQLKSEGKCKTASLGLNNFGKGSIKEIYDPENIGRDFPWGDLTSKHTDVQHADHLLKIANEIQKEQFGTNYLVLQMRARKPAVVAGVGPDDLEAVQLCYQFSLETAKQIMEKSNISKALLIADFLVRNTTGLFGEAETKMKAIFDKVNENLFRSI